jgi:DnaK suppressor protein
MASSKKTTTGKTVSKASPSKSAKPAAQKSIKKSVKSVKKSAAPAASKSGTQKKPASGGLIGRIKGALSKPKAAKPAATKPVAKPVSKPVSKAVAKAGKPVSAAAKVTKSVVAKLADKPAKTVTKPVANPVAAAKSRTSAPRSPAVQPPAPVSKKKARVSLEALSAIPLLTEDQIRTMSEDDYMNAQQLAFFRMRLLQMRDEVLQREVDVKERLHEREVFADPADRASAEEEHWLDLRLRERESLLLHKIDDALRRIESDEFGWCEKTGDAIGIPRLLARPTATVCVDVKGQDERVEAQFRDR